MQNRQANAAQAITTEFEELALAHYREPTPAVFRLLPDELVSRYARAPSMSCFLRAFEACIALFRLRIAPTRLLDQPLARERRRVKIVTNLSTQFCVDRNERSPPNCPTERDLEAARDQVGGSRYLADSEGLRRPSLWMRLVSAGATRSRSRR